jgi:hypothetical protein
MQQVVGGSPLPSILELIEEASGRSSSPDLKSSGQNFIATDELNATVAVIDTAQVTAWLSAHPLTNLLLAETQLKSASLPPEVALTPVMLNAETTIVPKSEMLELQRSPLEGRRFAAISAFHLS